MRFWTREIAGWLLVLLGLCGFYLCYELLTHGRTFETGCMTVISVIIFRGGIHLVKVAVAARICMQAQEQLAKAPPPPLATPPTGRALPRPTLANRTK